MKRTKAGPFRSIPGKQTSSGCTIAGPARDRFSCPIDTTVVRPGASALFDTPPVCVRAQTGGIRRNKLLLAGLRLDVGPALLGRLHRLVEIGRAAGEIGHGLPERARAD